MMISEFWSNSDHKSEIIAEKMPAKVAQRVRSLSQSGRSPGR